MFFHLGKIIQGAKLLLSENNFRKTHTDFRLFHKKGGLQEAIDDFRRLDPTDVRVVGVRFLLLFILFH